MENKELQGVKKALDAWRCSAGKGRFIPEKIWQRAAVVAQTVGMTKVQKELNLDFYSLKIRMDELGESTEGQRKLQRKCPNPTFVEYVVGTPAPTATGGFVGKCTIKVEGVSGARMLVEVTNLPAPSLASILRQFAR